MFVQFRPADALLSPEPGGDQGSLFAHNVVQGLYMCMCLIYYLFFVLYLFYLFRLNNPPPHGAVGGVTFHSGYLSLPRLTSTVPTVRGRFLALLLPRIGACVPLPFDKGLPCHSVSSVICLPYA